MTRHSLSVVIPAFNEAANIAGTLGHLTRALVGLDLDAEILVVDDGSTDGTSALALTAAERLPGVRLLSHRANRGFGAAYRTGVEAAAGDYIVMVHGDNAWDAETLRDLFAHVGHADVVVGYTRRMWRSRTFTRTVVSKTFTWLVNLITGRRLHYYNGLQIHRAEVLKALTIESRGYGFQAEVLVKALRRSRTYIEVPMDLMERAHGESKALRLKNAVDVLRTLRRLRDLEGQAAGR
jgi:glycosyltransferase involved in cell wall biosynthesis